MRWSNILYGIAAAFFTAGVIVEIQELKEREAVWTKAGANGGPDVTVEAEKKTAEKQE